MQHSLPPTALLPGIQYDKLAAAIGAKGYHATSKEELKQCLMEMLDYTGSLPLLLNVEILPSSRRKSQVSIYSWQDSIYWGRGGGKLPSQTSQLRLPPPPPPRCFSK